MTGTYRFSGSLFVRILAFVHVIAFASAWAQIGGLIGPHGILPAANLFPYVHDHYGVRGYLELPSLCWLFGTGAFLHVLCAAGVAVALLVFAGVAPAIGLGVLWILYLSLVCAGQIFFDYQWDALLLETTLLALFAAPWALLPGWRAREPHPLARWLLWWLLFRLMLLSGLVKLASGDPTWRNFTALTFHYWTQPLPTPLAWYAAQLPLWFDRASCLVMFFVELACPFAPFAPRAFRHAGALAMIAFQLLIALTGNYTFFNLLTIALCLTCLDDAWWGRLGIRMSAAGADIAPMADAVAGVGDPGSRPHRGRPPPDWLIGPFAAIVVCVTVLEAGADFVPRIADSERTAALLDRIAPFRSLNNYGLFAVMTTSRPELVIQGSDDRVDWKSYELPHKPGNPARAPDFIAPFQPRLDWQLWFAALETPGENRWVDVLCERLLRGDPAVLGLFAVNPFPSHPPRYIRVVRFSYRFTSAADRARTGAWWNREPTDFYVPASSLP